MKTVFLLIFLWTLAYAHPVPNRLSAHPGSSTEQEDTASEEHMNELVGLDDGDDGSPHGSRERGEMDVVGDSEDDDPADENDFGEEIAKHNSGAERSRIREAQDKNWVDHEDAGDLDEAEDQHKNSLGQHLHEKQFLEEEEDVHDAHNGDKREHYGAESRGSDSSKAGGNGLLYRPTGFFPRGGYRERSDLLDEEDDSGDDTFDENNEGEENGQDPTYTTGPTEAGERDAFGDNDQNGDHRDTMVSRRQHDDSSSSSSESRSLDHREYRNYIASRYGGTYRRGGDSDSSSQEERYDFDHEEMQGDDPSVFDSFVSNSKGLRAAFRYKESSQESSREAGKAVLKVSDQSEEESHSRELPEGPGDSEEDHSLQDDDSKSVDADSGEDSQAAEEQSESEEHVTSESKENSADRSREDEDSHSREDVDSTSREELASQSDEATRESQEENSREGPSQSDEHRRSKSAEGQEDGELAEDNSERSELDSESAEHDDGDQSESTEKSKSSEDTVESEEDGTDSVPDDDSSSRSKSTESQSTSREGDSSEEDPTTDSHESQEVPDEDSTSTESHSSDSKEEEHSHSAEEDSHSREDATNESTSHGDDSLPRSLESEKRKRRLRVHHNKHIGDYDDNDCQDGY